MTSNSKFTIYLTATFKSELNDIIHYFRTKLKEPVLAKDFYNKVIVRIYSLKYMPERHKKLDGTKRILRRMLVKNYIIIYEVLRDTRTSLYLTYFS